MISFQRSFSSSASHGMKKKALKAFKNRGSDYRNIPRKTVGTHLSYNDLITSMRQPTKLAGEHDLPALDGKQLQVGQAVKFSRQSLGLLGRLGSLTRDNHSELVGEPMLITKPELVELKAVIDAGLRSPSSENQALITGGDGIGKSTLLAQAEVLIKSSPNHIIIPIKNSEMLVNGRKDYLYSKELDIFQQPMLVKALLKRMIGSNAAALKSIKLTGSYAFQNNTRAQTVVNFAENNTLYDLASFHPHQRHAGDVFDALIKELTVQTQCPVFLTVDDFNTLPAYASTVYRNFDNTPLHVSKLQLPLTIFKLINGDLKFKKGGVILATSRERFYRSETLHTIIGKKPFNPYFDKKKFDKPLYDLLKSHNLKIIESSLLTRDNVGELVKKFKQFDAFNSEDASKPAERLTEEKFKLSGNGNPKQLLKSIVYVNV